MSFLPGLREVVLRAEYAAFAPPPRRLALGAQLGPGKLWRVDLDSFRHEVVCSLPGYLRGLGFVGPVALVGLAALRRAKPTPRSEWTVLTCREFGFPSSSRVSERRRVKPLRPA